MPTSRDPWPIRCRCLSVPRTCRYVVAKNRLDLFLGCLSCRSGYRPWAGRKPSYRGPAWSLFLWWVDRATAVVLGPGACLCMRRHREKDKKVLSSAPLRSGGNPSFLHRSGQKNNRQAPMESGLAGFATDQNRTGDTWIFSPLLYQLSYSGVAFAGKFLPQPRHNV